MGPQGIAGPKGDPGTLDGGTLVYLTTGECGEQAGLLSVEDHCDALTLPNTEGKPVAGFFVDVPANYPSPVCAAGTPANVQHDHTVQENWWDGSISTVYVTQWQCGTANPYKPAGRLVKQ
jgi:hypothetical protein